MEQFQGKIELHDPGNNKIFSKLQNSKEKVMWRQKLKFFSYLGPSFWPNVLPNAPRHLEHISKSALISKSKE